MATIMATETFNIAASRYVKTATVTSVETHIHNHANDQAQTQPTEEFIQTAINEADVNALRMALLHATEDKELEAMQVNKVDIMGGVLLDYALSPGDQDKVRQKALTHLLGGPHDAPPTPDKQAASRLMDLYADTPMKTDNTILFDYDEGYEELAFDAFPREVSWTNAIPPAYLSDYKVVIIGTGVSGIAAAIPLKKLGIPFEMIERQANFGGVWMQNDYPNVRVDVPAYLYQYRFTRGYRWKEFFPAGGRIRNYLQEVADKFGLAGHATFNQEAVAAKWDEDTSKWTLTVREQKTGAERTIVCNAIISASGLFSTPRLPDIKGIETFKGGICHTAQWDHSFSYANKRVALIGTGSTGTQLAPAIAQSAAHLAVYQRTANWIVPNANIRRQVTENIHWLVDNLPFYWNWFCYGAFFKSLNFTSIQDFDTEWQAKGGTISERNDRVRDTLTEYIRLRLKDRPDLAGKMIPKYSPGVRRKIVDNGFYETVQRPNVDLITDGINCITPTGIKTTDGQHREYDMIALGAGFSVMQYFHPLEYIGRNGMTLERLWEKDGARTYLGMCMPGMPNLFTMYGPNHQPRSGSVHSFAEKWARYAVLGIIGMIEGGKKSMEVRQEAFDEYQERLDAATAKLIWEYPGNGYFVNKHGRQFINMPWANAEYHPMIQKPDWNAFRMT